MDYLISFYSIIDYIGLFPLLKSVTRTEIQRLWISDFAHKKRKEKKKKVTKQPRNETQRTKQQVQVKHESLCKELLCSSITRKSFNRSCVWLGAETSAHCVRVSHIIHDPDKPHVQQFLPKSREKESGLKKKKKNTHIVSPLLSCKTIIVSR